MGKTEKPRLGRPRKFDDEAAFTATARAIQQHGFGNLTLAAVARELGCSAPALIERFGSKHGLLQAYLQWSESGARERFRRVRAAHDSPLEALVARFTLPRDERLDEVGTAEQYVNITLFNLSATADPALRPYAAARGKVFHDEICALLDEAIAAGELKPCDVERLARTLLAALSGVALQWASIQDLELEERITQGIEDLIAPYRLTG